MRSLLLFGMIRGVVMVEAKDKFPRLYALESLKECMVRDRGQVVNNVWVRSWAWRIPPRGRAIDELNTLQITMNSVLLPSNGCDKWFWTYDTSGFFKVKVLSKVIEFLLLGVHGLGSYHKWNSWIPRKVNVMVLKASIDRIATRSNLAARGVILPSPNCPFCASDIEDSEHVLLKSQCVSMI
ncbi:RNA-directed DNA polymerase, eukaryota, reverse transcriptase zinc-binding domain protein [Tanacetum coccineum]